MKTRKKVLKTHHCEVCDTGYTNQKEARYCESHPVEAVVAKIGDSLKLHGQRSCSCGKDYFTTGEVIGLTKPQSIPFGNALKLYGRPGPVNAHPIGYIVSYSCPKCKWEYQLVAYAHEFTVLKKVAEQATT